MLKAHGFSSDEHYEQICSWWRAHNWPVLPVEALPAIGRVVSHNGVNVCAGFLYRTDSAICLLEWIVSNPDFKDKPTRSDAIDFLIQNLLGAAQKLRPSIVFSYAKNDRLLKRYQDLGFQVSDKDMTHVVWANGG